jgi:RNA polymerase sigma-70 factor (ECF subfamily)
MAKKIDFIIDQLNKGNSSVYKQIFKEYYSTIRSFAYTYAQDDKISEDLTQDAFMKLWEKREQFKNSETLKSYLYTTVKNAFLNHIRHEQIQDKYKNRIKELLDGQYFVDTMIEEEVHTQIHKALKNLPFQSKRIVTMSMSGFTNPEIADKLSISINTVKTIKRRTYATLRKKLKGIYWILFLMMS